MPKIKTSSNETKDSSIKDLISHVSRIETSLDGIASTIKSSSKSNKENDSTENNTSELGTSISKMDANLDLLTKNSNLLVTRITEIRDFLTKNAKSGLGTTDTSKKGGLGKSPLGPNTPGASDDDKYGSIEKKDLKTRLLEKIAGNTENKNKDKKDEEKKEEKGGLLSKILGFAGKLILPMLAGLLLSGLKPLVKNLISGLFGNDGILGDIGDFVGGAVADMLPGAVAGYLLTKTWRGALIGATISYGAARLKEIVNDIVGMLNGEPREGAGELKGYEQKALAGALAGASLTGWKKGSFKAAVFGAGIGIGVEWLLNRANEIRAMIEGEQVDIKTIPGTGISEATAGGMIGGAVIGHSVGGWKGAAWGAAIGAIAGSVATVATDFNNRLQDAKSGVYTEPAEVCGVPYPIFTGIIAGAAIGAKFGGLVGGLVGAAIGGIAGLLYNWGSNAFMRTKATEAAGQQYIDKNLKDNKIVQGANAQNDALKNEIKEVDQQQADLKTKFEKGEISKNEYMLQSTQLDAKKSDLESKRGKVKSFKKDLKKRMGHVGGVQGKDGKIDTHALDADSDGIITKAEVASWRKKEGVNGGGYWISPNAWGSKGRTARRVESLLEGKDSITVDELVDATAKHAKLDTKNLPTANQISADKTNKEQLQVQKEQLDAQRTQNETMEKVSDNLLVLADAQRKENAENNDGAYATTGAHGAGQKKGG